MELHRTYQCLGADDPRRRARAGLRAARHAEQRFLRRPPPRRQSVCRVAGVSRRQHRRAQVALPVGPSRTVGLRQPVAAQPGHDSCRRQDHRGRCPADQTGVRLCLRSRHRQTGLADPGTAGSGERRRWRAGLGDTACADAAARLLGAGRVARRRVRSHARVEGGGAKGIAEIPDRSAVHAAKLPWHRPASRAHRRRQLGRRRLRRAIRCPVLQDHEPGEYRSSGKDGPLECEPARL